MNVVFGGQAGSEAKGKLAGYLVDKYDIKVIAGCLSPNAGHTLIKDGVKVVTHHIPVSLAAARDITKATVVLGPASVINPKVLIEELPQLIAMGFAPNRQLFIDPMATIIEDWHVAWEGDFMIDIGSTAQGVGMARADRVMRRGMVARDVECLHAWISPRPTNEILMDYMYRGHTVMYEMGQGFDLCQFHGVDPVYCTSRNCTPMQAFADAGVPLKYAGDTYAVIRSYPIRVNNRTGSSGPYPSKEITWEKVTQRSGSKEPIAELTTTTKLPRRVFEFSFRQYDRMLRTCDPTHVCLQFVNYLDATIKGTRSEGGVSVWANAISGSTGKLISYVGSGPNHEDMVDRGLDDEPWG